MSDKNNHSVLKSKCLTYADNLIKDFQQMGLIREDGFILIKVHRGACVDAVTHNPALSRKEVMELRARDDP